MTKTRLLIVLAAAIAVCLIIALLLTQPMTPSGEPTRPQMIRAALFNMCNGMTTMLYPDLSQKQVSTACFQEASALYTNHPDDAAYCYDTVKSDDLMKWGDCFTERDIDFSGTYVDQERGMP